MTEGTEANAGVGAESTDMPVRTRGLRKEFGELIAVADLDLRVSRGLLYGLIGPNGSGKTTAIRMLVGLLRPTGGEAHLLGERVPVRGCRARMGYMPQEMAIYSELTVHENLELFAGLYSMDRTVFEKREGELLGMIDLEDRRHSLVSQLSGGMRHRVSLACALIHDPELVFLDEPTVGVDPELRVGFWQHFRGLKSAGKTIVLTTHYMDEAVRCDVVGMMRAGRLIAEGTPKELMGRAGATDLESAFMEFSRRGLA
jgi:ABC-2 type transport system ATP-binding protein